MTSGPGPSRPPQAGPRSAPSAPGPGPEAPAHPLAGPVADWLQLVSRALRAARFYPPASATRVQQMEAATQALPKLFLSEASFSLRVKEDRLLLAKKPVLIDEDRVNGLPYLLFSQSIMEVSFERGVSAQELGAFLEAVVSDFSSEELGGEDLATVLWRLELPHIRYQHVDVLTAAFQARGDDLGAFEDPEVRRLRLELEAMIGALSINPADGSDFRVMFDGGLESPETAQAAEAWEANNLAHVGGLFESMLPSGALSAFRAEVLESEKPELVSLRLLEHLLQDPMANFKALTKLVEGALRAHDFESSMRIMERLRESGDGSDRVTEAAHLLIDRLASKEQILHAVEALVKTDRESERARVLSYLRMVGVPAAPSILEALDQVEAPGLLDALADVVVDAVLERPELVEDLSALSARSVSALLRASASLPPGPRSAVIWAASGHGDPEVRLLVLETLQGFGPGHADSIIVNALKDKSPAVRERAVVLCGERKIPAALPALARMVRAREQEEMGGDTLGALLRAYARVGGSKVISDLLRILNQSPKLTELRKSAQLLSDAAMALAVIEDDAAREHLSKGAKSLNPALRKACKDALGSTSRFGMTGPLASLPPLSPRIETELPTGIAAPARSSAPPPPLSSPPPRPPPSAPPVTSRPPPGASTPPRTSFHGVSPEFRTESMPAPRRSGPVPPAPVELPMEALEPLPAIPPPPPSKPPASGPPASRLTPEVVDDLFRFLEEDG